MPVNMSSIRQLSARSRRTTPVKAFGTDDIYSDTQDLCDSANTHTPCHLKPGSSSTPRQSECAKRENCTGERRLEGMMDNRADPGDPRTPRALARTGSAILNSAARAIRAAKAAGHQLTPRRLASAAATGANEDTGAGVGDLDPEPPPAARRPFQDRTNIRGAMAKPARGEILRRCQSSSDSLARKDAIAKAGKSPWDSTTSKLGNRTRTPKDESEAAQENGTSLSSGVPMPQVIEEKLLTSQILASVYKRTLSHAEAHKAIDSCPELVWLAQCMVRCPMPPGWRKTVDQVEDGRDTRPLFTCETTGEVSEAPPHLGQFSRLARFMLHARQNPEGAIAVESWLQTVVGEALAEAARRLEGWTGPHQDPSTGHDFFYCVRTGRSSWESPGECFTYIARAAERLLDSSAFPRRNVMGDADILSARCVGLQPCASGEQSSIHEFSQRAASKEMPTSSISGNCVFNMLTNASMEGLTVGYAAAEMRKSLEDASEDEGEDSFEQVTPCTPCRHVSELEVHGLYSGLQESKQVEFARTPAAPAPRVLAPLPDSASLPTAATPSVAVDPSVALADAASALAVAAEALRDKGDAVVGGIAADAYADVVAALGAVTPVIPPRPIVEPPVHVAKPFITKSDGQELRRVLLRRRQEVDAKGQIFGKSPVPRLALSSSPNCVSSSGDPAGSASGWSFRPPMEDPLVTPICATPSERSHPSVYVICSPRLAKGPIQVIDLCRGEASSRTLPADEENITRESCPRLLAPVPSQWDQDLETCHLSVSHPPSRFASIAALPEVGLSPSSPESFCLATPSKARDDVSAWFSRSPAFGGA